MPHEHDIISRGTKFPNLKLRFCHRLCFIYGWRAQNVAHDVQDVRRVALHSFQVSGLMRDVCCVFMCVRLCACSLDSESYLRD